eukprot:9259390-Alexandrium_andersonii.AAC.1
MSASLVGSEMCIRDSCQTLPDTARHCRTQPDTARHSRTQPDTAGHCRTCLLYTSDAADDM